MRHLHPFTQWFPLHLFCFIQSFRLHLVHPHISHIVYIMIHKLFFNHLYLHQGLIHPITTSTCSLSWLCHFYIIKTSLTHHQTSCTTHKQSSTSKVPMFSTLPSFFLSLAWTWITSIDHQCFPSWFITPPFIPLYSICYLCWSSTCFTHPFNLVGYWSIRHNNVACIFVLSFLVFFFFTTGWWKRPPKNSHMFVLVHGKGLGKITRGAYD